MGCSFMDGIGDEGIGEGGRGTPDAGGDGSECVESTVRGRCDFDIEDLYDLSEVCVIIDWTLDCLDKPLGVLACRPARGICAAVALLEPSACE